ncbi:hypothetical protein T11_3969 [Trichinella zimbabwensis]|uniref:Uncharacterized protein n=1 Tax=Trichinella zimbabwensis TaxID=268475 RepID=A0A0V1HF51_9BILA|nr:hypothetical protein T11_3969 [Trichinella zimbabwensis]
MEMNFLAQKEKLNATPRQQNITFNRGTPGDGRLSCNRNLFYQITFVDKPAALLLILTDCPVNVAANGASRLAASRPKFSTHFLICFFRFCIVVALFVCCLSFHQTLLLNLSLLLIHFFFSQNKQQQATILTQINNFANKFSQLDNKSPSRQLHSDVGDHLFPNSATEMSPAALHSCYVG